MSSTDLLKQFLAQLDVTPVPGAANVHVIQPKPQSASAGEEYELTEADWDKFEADINEAFEQVP